MQFGYKNLFAMAAKHLIVLAVIFGISWAQTDIPNVLDSVTLPDELQAKLDPKVVEGLQNKSISEFRNRCDKNGGPEAFARVENASRLFTQCITSLVNTSSLQQEIEEAKPNGRVDEVFKKYCDKKPQFEGCIQNLTDSSKPCFSPKEQTHLKTVYNVSQQLAEFICFKEGDRIALFIAEGGQECFQDKQEGLKDCFNKTFGVDAQLDMEALSDVTLSFDEKQCKQVSELQSCVVTLLETCPKPTSANIVESLFKFIRKSTPCKQFPDAKAKPRSHNHNTESHEPKAASAPGLVITGAALLMAAATTLVV